MPVQEPSPGWGVSTDWAAGGQASLRAQSNGPRTGAATPEGVAGIPVEGDAPYTLSAVVRASRLDPPRPAYLRLRWSSVTGALISYSPRLYLDETRDEPPGLRQADPLARGCRLRTNRAHCRAGARAGAPTSTWTT